MATPLTQLTGCHNQNLPLQRQPRYLCQPLDPHLAYYTHHIPRFLLLSHRQRPCRLLYRHLRHTTLILLVLRQLRYPQPRHPRHLVEARRMPQERR